MNYKIEFDNYRFSEPFWDSESNSWQADKIGYSNDTLISIFEELEKSNCENRCSHTKSHMTPKFSKYLYYKILFKYFIELEEINNGTPVRTDFNFYSLFNDLADEAGSLFEKFSNVNTLQTAEIQTFKPQLQVLDDKKQKLIDSKYPYTEEQSRELIANRCIKDC